jgi:hypothetical protein
MRVVIFAWASGTEADFEERFALALVGRHYRELGFSGPIDLVFLSDLGRLSPAYRAELERSGYELNDASAVFARIDESFPGLADLRLTERMWLLRWLVARERYEARPTLHLDADVVLNEDPAVVARLAEGLTFVLQGCPALAAISDPTWYVEWESALRAFSEDRDAYSRAAWAEREGWRISMRTRWAGSRFSREIRHEQDLLSHLIHTRRIRQDPVEEVLHAFDGYLLFENPLFFDVELDFLSFGYARSGGIDYLDCRAVEDLSEVVERHRPLCWHMQTFAARYIGKALALARFAGGRPFGRLGIDLRTERLDSLARRVKIPSRLELYRQVFESGDFGPAFNPRLWWRQGVFT